MRGGEEKRAGAPPSQLTVAPWEFLSGPQGDARVATLSRERCAGLPAQRLIESTEIAITLAV